MSSIRISRQTMRRFVLGKAGLFPGRRWRGADGVRQVLQNTGSVQIDPVHVIARNHDLILWSRVANYQPEHLDDLAYNRRICFDYGTTLFMYPMEEIPYWRAVMRSWESSSWVQRIHTQHPDAHLIVRSELRSRGPLAQRDLVGAKVSSYRARKDTGLAFYALWLTGELMTHSRRGFDRVYYFGDEIVPGHLREEKTMAEADAYFSRKIFGEMAMCTATEWTRRFRIMVERPLSTTDARKVLAAMHESGVVTTVEVEGLKAHWYVLADDVPLLDRLERGELPPDWQPIDSSTQTEAVFLAPLDMVSARGRAKPIFDFEYIWEIYKPQHQRRWGYYTLPILYGDRLVGRMDSKLNRGDNKLIVNGLWLEDETLARDTDFADALSNGFINFTRFHGARQADLTNVASVPLKRRLAKAVKTL